eukprot:1497700-Rhodomonas_salina.4
MRLSSGYSDSDLRLQTPRSASGPPWSPESTAPPELALAPPSQAFLSRSVHTVGACCVSGGYAKSPKEKFKRSFSENGLGTRVPGYPGTRVPTAQYPGYPGTGTQGTRVRHVAAAMCPGYGIG